MIFKNLCNSIWAPNSNKNWNLSDAIFGLFSLVINSDEIACSEKSSFIKCRGQSVPVFWYSLGCFGGLYHFAFLCDKANFAKWRRIRKIAYLLNTNSVVISITPSQLKVKNEKVKPPFSTKFSHEISIYWSETISHIKFDIFSRN